MIDKNLHLNNVLVSHDINKIEELKNKFIEKRTKVKEAIEIFFKGFIYNPINSGSYAKHTMINYKFDLDLAVPFIYKIGKLEEMYGKMFDFLDVEYRKTDKTLVEVRKQRTSLGLTFNDGNDKIELDIVPGREIGEDNYRKDNFLNLCIYESPWGKISHIQTNIQKHIEIIRGRNDIREVVKLLKVWKLHWRYKTQIKIKSFLIELMTINAFDEIKPKFSGIWEKLEMVLKYIQEKIEKNDFKDPACSSNIVSDTLTDNEKRIISNEIKIMLEEIAKNPDILKDYFPENPDYPSEETQNAKYAVAPGFKKLSNNDFG